MIYDDCDDQDDVQEQIWPKYSHIRLTLGETWRNPLLGNWSTRNRSENVSMLKVTDKLPKIISLTDFNPNLVLPVSILSL